jgi:uncharacterized protein VirK/YbjX
MKTTIDIPIEELEEAIKHTRAKTKKEAIVFVIKDFNKRKRLTALTRNLGTFEEFMTQDDLKKGREEELWDKTT